MWTTPVQRCRLYCAPATSFYKWHERVAVSSSQKLYLFLMQIPTSRPILQIQVRISSPCESEQTTKGSAPDRLQRLIECASRGRITTRVDCSQSGHCQPFFITRCSNLFIFLPQSSCFSPALLVQWRPFSDHWRGDVAPRTQKRHAWHRASSWAEIVDASQTTPSSIFKVVVEVVDFCRCVA